MDELFNFVTEGKSSWTLYFVFAALGVLVVLLELQREKDAKAKCLTCGGCDLKRSSKPSWLTQKNDEYFCYKCQRYFSKP